MKLLDQAIAAHQSGNLIGAESLYRRILAADSRDFDALHMLGIICAQHEKYDEAERLIRTALSIDAKVPQCYHNYGTVLAKLNRHKDAIDNYNKALAISPNYFSVYSDRGNCEQELGRFEEALVSYGKALAFKSEYADAWLGRGNTLFKLMRYDEALAAYDKALTLRPDLANAWLGRGNVFADIKRYDEAFAAYDKTQKLRPDFGEGHFNEAWVRLSLGDTERGWKKYEYRWDTRQFMGWKRKFPQPLWVGDSPIANKTILLHAEQGFGDTIMGCRYVPMVAALGAKIILEVQSQLASLCQNLEGVSILIARGDQVPDFDIHCPLMSLPLAFKTRLDTIPATVPYLKASKDIIEKWRPRLGERGFKIGVGWAGNQKFQKDHDRSILLRNILPVFSVLGATYFSIQKDLRDGDQEILNANPQIIQLGGAINDFQDTAAVMMSLDLIISSDTSTVNLAGALGRPVWALLPSNPDWRWLLDRSDSPWYPTAKLFRQTKNGDWGTVVDEVCAQLGKHIGSAHTS